MYFLTLTRRQTVLVSIDILSDGPLHKNCPKSNTFSLKEGEKLTFELETIVMYSFNWND